MQTLDSFVSTPLEAIIKNIWETIIRKGKCNVEYQKSGTGPKYEDPDDIGNAGTINLVDAKILFNLIRKFSPAIINVFELGTWFGTSAGIMASAGNGIATVHTCDRKDWFVLYDSDLVCEELIKFYHKESNKALKRIKTLGIKFDFAFIDGSLRNKDAVMLFRSMRRKIFAFHDFVGNEKGVRAYKEIRKLMSGKLIRPANGSTIAVYYDPNDWNPGV